MSEISVIGNAVVGNVRSAAPTTRKSPVEVVAPATTTDRVDFSEQAQLLEKIHQLPQVRQDKIDVIKEAIANNTYLTDDKLDVAIDRMISEITH